MATEHTVFAGFTQVDFTPDPGLPLHGQMHQRHAIGARDPLQACAIALRQGEQTVVLIAVDVIALHLELIESIQKEWQRRSGFPAESLLLQATHTHDAPATAPSTLDSHYVPTFVESLRRAILLAAQEAVEKLEPVLLFSGCGHLEQMGWNRRAMLEDGTTQMYGHSQLPGFIGMEGPRDPALPVLFTRNLQGEITGVLVNFATHPNAIEAAEVYSADIPGAVRRHIKRLLGESVGVVYMTGAAGDTAPSILDPLDEAQPWRGEAGLERSGLYVAAETAKVIAAAIEPMADPVLDLRQTVLEIPVRDWPQPSAPDHGPKNFGGSTYYEDCEIGWPGFKHRYDPYTVRVNVLRIGDAVICTNPAELFVDFGLQIRALSPARVTFISELTDGCTGYIPTPQAFERGGYETWCARSSPLIHSAGDQIVAATKELLNSVF